MRPSRRLWASPSPSCWRSRSSPRPAAASSQVTWHAHIRRADRPHAERGRGRRPLDQTADPDAGAILGEDRIDDPGAIPIAFSVPYTAAIDPTHSYALYASVVDGSNTWENNEPVPVITGGPSSGVEMLLPMAPSSFAGTISGTIVESAEPIPGPESVVVAALINQKTGTLVGHDFNVSPTPRAARLPSTPSRSGTTRRSSIPAVTYVVEAA
jgi:hypothetical protein